jgi:hypothetical protein
MISTTPTAGNIPRLLLPDRPEWLALYDSAWSLTKKAIVAEPALPAQKAYCDYPDNGFTYAWDSCFCLSFQRYAIPSSSHPGLATLDNFYARQFSNGYIPRCYQVRDFTIRRDHIIPCVTGTNPPLFAWAEWQVYLITGDTDRLSHVLPALIKHYDWIETALQDSPGRYLWDGDGSGWDNINWDQGDEAILHWVEMPALQACAADHISRMAETLGRDDVAARFRADVELKQQIMEDYWDDEAGWYRSLNAAGGFTRKVSAGFWPVFANLVEGTRIRRMLDENVLNPESFLTEPMPLPTIARDQPGYNPKGEYWKGGVWIPISYMVIDALDRHGFVREARDLATRTLDGMARTFYEWEACPHTLWEAYAPEVAAPASHKNLHRNEPGGVRGEFGGWACCLINLLIETELGLTVNAPANSLDWKIRTAAGTGIEDLRFANVTASLRIEKGPPENKRLQLSIQTNASFMLNIDYGGAEYQHHIEAGSQVIQLPTKPSTATE